MFFHIILVITSFSEYFILSNRLFHTSSLYNRANQSRQSYMYVDNV
jgi:hypothetical protein